MSHVAAVTALGAESPFRSSQNATVRPVFASQEPSYVAFDEIRRRGALRQILANPHHARGM